MTDPTVLEDLRRLVEPATMGDPLRPLLWVSKSREKLADALRAMNHAISANTVAKMLVALGYSRQVNRKTKEGSHHADRDGQCQHINCQALRFRLPASRSFPLIPRRRVCCRGTEGVQHELKAVS